MSAITKEELPQKFDAIYSSQLSEEIKIVIKANSKQRSELATRFNLYSINTLVATLTIINTKPGFFHVKGIIDSDLKIFDSEINDIIDFTLNDHFDELFALPEALESEDKKDIQSQFDFELIENNVVPLGEVVAQNFSLALEYLFINSPSSSTQNIVFSDELNDKNIEDNPFAVLKTLGKQIKN
ncbi:MAG: hypothetical protein CMM43_04430 [Rhodospirillaceae bacterium]|nr:hypothetical protein [Rhodospirillaceae bacterium]|tara:strand:- start:4081 stop:4632 length:552 start_codon:yes stop_codon:yes gene_type:complete